MATEFNKNERSFVVSGLDWYCIDTSGKKPVKLFTLDNGPDYPGEGMKRYVDEQGRMGYADDKCSVVIPARFDSAWPFEGGRARVCAGCLRTFENEMLKVSGGDNYFIDRQVMPSDSLSVLLINAGRVSDRKIEKFKK